MGVIYTEDVAAHFVVQIGYSGYVLRVIVLTAVIMAAVFYSFSTF